MPKKRKKSELLHPASEYGTDREYLSWLSYQPSAVDGSFNQWDDEGIGRSIACHVRRVNRGAGIGIKPSYSAIPMTHSQHLREDDYPIEWRIEQADKHLEEWIECQKKQ